jgi:hypothetical protein
MKNGVVVLILASALAGCAMPSATGLADDMSFKVAPDKAGVYVFRTGTAGAAIRIGVELDGTPIGSTVAQTHVYRDIEPGRHTLSSAVHNRATLQFDAEPGEIVFIRQDFQLGYLQAHTRLHRVPPSEGMLGVRQTSAAKPGAR